MQIAELFFTVTGEGFDKLGGQITQLGTGITSVGTSLTNGITKPLVGIAAGIMDTTMQFDAGMSQVQAISGATGDDMVKLRTKAKDMGATTKFSATQSAEAMNFMAMAGWDSTQIIDGLGGVMDLAAASGEDLGSVSDIVTDSMTAFGMEAKEAGTFSDLLATAASSANTTVGQLGESFKYAAPVAGALGFSARDTSFALGLMANAGIKASQSGTSMRTIMTNLVKPTDASAKAMKELGVEILDSDGNMKSLDTIMGDLRTGFSKLTKDQKAATAASIAGKTGMSGLLAIVNTAPEAYDKLGKALDNSEGSARRMAETMQDNLAGQMTKLGSAAEGIAIQFGEILTPVLRFFVSGIIMPLVDALGRLPQPFKAVIVVVATLLASIGPILLALGTFVTILGTVITAAGAIVTAIGLITPVMIGVTAAIVAVLAVGAAFIGFISLVVIKLGLFQDAIASIKALISGDFQNMFDLLHKNFGMSAEKATILARKFEEMADKAKVIAKVIQDNLSIAMDVLGEAIGDLMSGGMADLNKGTQASKDLFSDMVQGIIKWGSQLVDYLYNLFDLFGLIPVEMKFANNKVAGEYVRLHATTQSHYNDLIRMQLMFNGELTEANLKAYQDKLIDTQVAMDGELNLVLSEMAKRKEAETTALKDLFANSQVLTEEAETAKLESLKEYYGREETDLKNNYTIQKEIMETAFEEKRGLTEQENQELTFLREAAGARTLQYITTNSLEQRRILEESKNLVHDISKEQALNTITQANKAYDAVVKKAEEQKNKKIETAIIQRDEVGTLSKEEAENVIKEANWQYTMSTGLAEDTKDETILSAEQKYEGVLTAAEKEKRDVETQADKIKKILIRIWNDIKKKIPKIVDDLGKEIVKYLKKHKKPIETAAYKIGSDMVQKIIDGIGSKMKALGRAVANALTFGTIDYLEADTYIPPNTTLAPQVLPWNARASGEMNYAGGMTLVGEEGPELLNLPKGTDIYSNPATRGMLNNMKPNMGAGGNAESVNLYGNIVIDAHNVQDFTDVVSLLKNVKRHSSMR